MNTIVVILTVAMQLMSIKKFNLAIISRSLLFVAFLSLYAIISALYVVVFYNFLECDMREFIKITVIKFEKLLNEGEG